ncbi:MAG: transketolase C-terminal domain-containing protein [Actinomycetota bacterium]|nr:transketolase C-terminal domain-containing protein [Actinomycetota bacterium]
MANKQMTGCIATATGCKLADVDVICSYPIRPYTGIMSELARMVADGELDAEFVLGEGEHGQLTVTYGASAAGARAFTGSSGVGVVYAFELYSPMAGERLPAQMAIADRTLDPPGDFGEEHTDAMCCRDQGWIQGWASTAEEALDITLMYYRIGEDYDVMLPQYACQDGYFVSHIVKPVDEPDQAAVNEFLPPFKPRHGLFVDKPEIIGPQAEPEEGPFMQHQRYRAIEDARPIIEKAVAEYNEIIGRNYDPWLEEYLCDDADYVIFEQGAHAETAKAVADVLRNEGVKAGVVRLRTLRPFPTKQVADSLSRFKAVGVVDCGVALGISGAAGILFTEVRSALYDAENKPLTVGFVAGLGGAVITHDQFYDMYKKLEEVAAAGKEPGESYWFPFDL